MKFNSLIIIYLSSIFFFSCNMGESTGLPFNLMKETPVWSIAKAVRDEDTAEIRVLIQEKHLDVNYKEMNSAFGVTLLHLAVYHSKLLSVKALLENGARQDIRDSSGNYPITCIVDMTTKYENRVEILKLLLQHGADPNSQVKGYRRKESIPFLVGVPLMQASHSLECTKLLIKYGADVYCKIKARNFLDSCHNYPVWDAIFLLTNVTDHDNIFVAKYLVVDNHLAIPNPLYYRGYNTEYDIRPVSAIDLLNKATFTDSAKQKAKEEILAYLQKEGFPEHGSIPNPPPKR